MMDQPSSQSNTTPGLPPLPAGAIVGNYVIKRLIRDGADGNSYLASNRAETDIPYQMLEYPASEVPPLAALARLHLDHPALLAPREALTLGERAYVISPLPPHAQPIGPLPPLEALQQIIAIGEALVYLHSRGVAHLRVQPASIVLVDGEARLSGLEDAQIVRVGADDARLLFERDANFLALTLEALASADSNHESSPLKQAIDKIREQGISHSYQSAAQVIADCQQALAPFQAGTRPGSQARTPASSALSSPAFTVFSGHATSAGCVRANNEDAFGELLLTMIDGEGRSRLIACFIVADGVGGEARGEVASQIAVQSILEHITRRLALPLLQQSDTPAWPGAASALERERQMREALVEGFRAANRQIHSLPRAQRQMIGTTATTLLIVAGQALIAHVGDSRAYRLNRGVLTALTEDHSYVQRLIQLGQIDPADHASYPRRNALYRVLGQHDELDVDLIACPLEAGDHLLLCSDGLWDAVPEAALANLLADQGHHTSPAARAAHLVALADKAGGKDNSTAVVIEITGEQA
jgi:serine/threonine protein phosphatase PrpC